MGFNVYETFEIAEQVEHKDALLYLSIARHTGNTELQSICYKLANWKAKYEKVLKKRRQIHSARTGEFGTFDPDDYVLSNPHVMASLATLTERNQWGDKALHTCTPAELLRGAIMHERDIAVFFEGLKGFALGPASQQVIDQVLGEETRHIGRLCKLAGTS